MLSSVILIPAYQPDVALLHLAKQLTTLNQSLIVVNDGSDERTAPIFQAVEALPGVVVLHHAKNLGKGEALKTGFRYILEHLSEQTPGVVTADADGQHVPEDILSMSQALVKHPQALQLGVRHFSNTIPFRSQFGNKVTRVVFKRLTGKAISDTQTGLRGIPVGMLPCLVALKGSGYAFELEMLLEAVQQQYLIEETPIQTIYENGNASSHFSPLRDSLRIYAVFFRFWLSRLRAIASLRSQ